MSRVITFSRTFPSYHPKAGQPTYFVEKIWNSKRDGIGDLPDDYTAFVLNYINNVDGTPNIFSGQKFHTIRAGHRWKAGDWFSPRVWSGKPYNSKQIQFAPDIQIKKVWDVEFDGDGCLWIFSDKERGPRVLHTVAKNDGLTLEELISWFNKPFTGQIICWNEQINY
jgi:hypothetical protein